MRYGLLGETLGHSFSPMIYEMLGLPGYELFPMSEAEIAGFLASGALRGLNVTIPYKKKAMAFCDTLSDTARRLGNVNTLLFDDAGRIYGHNTDYAGFLYLLKQAGLSPAGKKVVILGTGGAAQTARLACLDTGADAVVTVSRTGGDNYRNIGRHADAALLINATPVGMYPHDADLPLSLDSLPHLEGVVDLIYNPLRTRLLTEAAQHGLRTAGGIAMLAAQGKAAAELFLGKKIPEGETLRICRALQGKTENIVLVGMPGVGKTTIGTLLAARTGRRFVDTDALLQERTGRSAAVWIAKDGEAVFRTKEKELVKETAHERGIVIATGGGAVLAEENRTVLRRSGRVYWLRRPPEQLATDDRPLSQEGSDLWELLERRRPLYDDAAHVALDACGDFAEIAKEIETEFHAHIDDQWI